ncbi:hypothetical protein FJZ36_11920 [Candidatus Poribacteria bacterium]|nr:hypothetical protein [Candidatus Poribacteria bacterium]
MSLRNIGIGVVLVGFGLALTAAAETPFEFKKWKKGENLVVGGDFEELTVAGANLNAKDGKKAWTLEDGKCCDRGAEYKWEIAKDEKHGGDRSLRVIGVKASGTDWHAKVRHDSTSMRGGSEYTVAFWAKADAARTVALSVQLQHDPWTFFQGGDFSLTKEWAEYTKTFTAPQDIDKDMWVGLAIAKTDQSFWIDDFRFWEGKLDDEIRSDPKPRAVDPSGKTATVWADLKY